MRDYIILNGVNSNTITGLLISKLPPITKPKQRTTVEEIDGRDGDIVTKLGYSAYDKEIEIGLYGDFDIDDVMTFFNGEGTVTFSNEPDKFYNYQILDQIDYEKLIRFKKAKVKMHVQPFKYPLEETPVEITIQTVNNEAEEMDLDNTKEAPMKIDLNGNTYQEGTPTPETPQDIHVVSGDNSIEVSNGDNTQSASYPISLGNIELCKIGDYQDKIFKNTPNTTDYDSNLEDNVWYLKKKIGKKDNLVSDFVSVFTNYSNLDYIRFLKPSDSATKGNATNIPALLTSGKYAMNYNFNNADYINYFSPNGEYTNFWLGVTKGTTTEQAQTILTNSTLYYPLATPTYTEITDSTLLSQLNALANATSYDTKTHITQNANDKPFILNATAIKQGSGEATVSNEGNMYSKPTLDIEGSGTIGIYLDGNQMFSVDLSNATECIIDTAKLEAYDPSTSELMNRQVTGDYSNFKLNAGENQVSTTGEIEKVTISNYTRWL